MPFELSTVIDLLYSNYCAPRKVKVDIVHLHTVHRADQAERISTQPLQCASDE